MQFDLKFIIFIAVGFEIEIVTNQTLQCRTKLNISAKCLLEHGEIPNLVQ